MQTDGEGIDVVVAGEGIGVLSAGDWFVVLTAEEVGSNKEYAGAVDSDAGVAYPSTDQAGTDSVCDTSAHNVNTEKIGIVNTEEINVLNFGVLEPKSQPALSSTIVTDYGVVEVVVGGRPG